MPRWIAALTLLLLSSPGLILASQWSGFEITYGDFEIDVYYNDVVESPPSLYIRDPKYVLLNLLRFLKANGGALYFSRQTILVDLEEGQLTISERYTGRVS